MAKKQSPRAEAEAASSKEAASSPRRSGLLGWAFDITKFILGICFLPFVYSTTISFLDEFSVVDSTMQRSFWAGAVTFLIIYLFIWEPVVLYARGQRVLEIVFSFFKPLVKVAPYLLPIYVIILCAAYWAFSFFMHGLTRYFIYAFGLSIALHLIFSAKSMRSKQGDFLKANYIFGFSFIYILNIMLVAFCLNLIFDKFSFVRFLNFSYHSARDIFYAVFKQLFLIKG